MPSRFNIIFATALTAVIALGFFILTFERPPVESVQSGFRGTAMQQLYNPRTVEQIATRNVVPAALDPADTSGPRASEVYENVRVLGHLSIDQFGRIMQAITEWVYPENEADPENTGCNGCHVPGNFAAEGKYTKTVARRMLQMTQTINTTWAPHVLEVGVTCYTCHRGQNVPAAVWSQALPNATPSRSWQTASDQNRPVPANAFTSLPTDPLTAFFWRDNEIRLISTSARQEDNLSSIQKTEWVYALMNRMSTALGVNCTFCHNSRSFSSWETSPPQRLTAWHGIRMVRNINNEYIEALRPVFPPNRLGPMGDTLKVNCATCHQGVFQPLYGAEMLKDYPELNPPPRRAEATSARN